MVSEYVPSPFQRWVAPYDILRGVQEKIGLQSDINQVYLNWLKSYLYALQFTDKGIGDPYKAGSDANKLITEAATRLDEGWNVASLPYYDQFIEIYRGIYPAETAMMPEESAYVQAQTDYLYAQIQQILNNISQSGQMTPYEQGYLDYLMKQLEYQMQQAGVGAEQEWARIDLERQQLAQQTALEQQRLQQGYQQYLAELQASPATWLERWYAEKQPWGGARIPLASDVTLSQGMAGGRAGGWQIPVTGSWTTPQIPTP